MRTEILEADLLILGGGTAGCFAALTASRLGAGRILLVEKAHIERSGCLAAGVNAINAYIGPGHIPGDYVEYVRRDSESVVRADLLLGLAKRFNAMVEELERLGVAVLKDEKGGYALRGWRNVKINGENIKPLLAGAAAAAAGVTVVNRVNATSLLTNGGRVSGAVGFGSVEPVQYVFLAPAVICATGGAAGLYRSNRTGSSRHAAWYPPFNSGGGYAMGIRAGAEMTSLEMRFVALRCRDTAAPTGTLALGAAAIQVNSLGEAYESRYGSATHQRVLAARRETLAGRGPCRLAVENPTPEIVGDLYRAYLNMAPSQTLKWLEQADATPGFGAEVECSEPYVVGGHAAAGYWVDARRETTIRGLFAAGDVAGGCPQKYVSGAMAEGEIAAAAAVAWAKGHPLPADAGWRAGAAETRDEAELFLGRERSLFTADEIEEAMQQVMDHRAGGIGSDYRYNRAQLKLADARIRELAGLAEGLAANGDMRELLRLQEIRDRLVVCRSLIAHLAARRETRWPGFGEYADFPERDEAGPGYVNSRLRRGEIEIIYRSPVRENETYEHRD